MTAERNNAETDRLVSQTYSELAVEKVPEHLSQTILRQAEASGRRRSAGHFSLSAWMKPVAWSATIGLSLAIVLELTQIPTVPVQETLNEKNASEEVDILSVPRKEIKGMISQPAAADRSFTKMQMAEPAATERAESLVSGDALTCAVTAQESADDWMDCIRDLRETGAFEQANREYEAFLLKYPAE